MEPFIGQNRRSKGYDFANLHRLWVKMERSTGDIPYLAKLLSVNRRTFRARLHHLSKKDATLGVPHEKLVVLEIFLAHWRPQPWDRLRDLLKALKPHYPGHGWARFYRTVIHSRHAKVILSRFLAGTAKTIPLLTGWDQRLREACARYGISLAGVDLNPKNPWPTTPEETLDYVLAYPKACADALANQGEVGFAAGETVTVGVLMNRHVDVPTGCEVFVHSIYCYNAVVCRANATMPEGILFATPYELTGKSPVMPLAA